MDTAFKRSLQHSENYHRKGFGQEAEVANLLQSEYQSNLVQQIRTTTTHCNVMSRFGGGVWLCWGGARALPWHMKLANISH